MQGARNPGCGASLAPARTPARTLGRTLERALVGFVAGFVDDLYPPVSWLSGRPLDGATTCEAHRLPVRPPGPRCGRCQVALAPAFPDGDTCPRCRTRPPRFGRTVALGDYRQARLREWVLALKHGGRADLAAPLASALARRVRAVASFPGDAWLVPVPLHPLRRLERGHDQALLLARGLGEELELPVRIALRRRRFTPPQGAPGARARHVNLRGAFAPEPDLARQLVGRDLVLVDDVLTSGATLEEGARVLRRAGARRVDALVLACARSDG